MTLNRYKFELFSRNFSRDLDDLGGNNGKTNEDRPILSGWNCIPLYFSAT